MPDLRTLTIKGFTVTIASDQIWMTVYDSFGEPCGTIERPHRGQPVWQSYAPTGQAMKPGGCVGPLQALRCLSIYHGA
jgi:hypothetical protein